MPTLVERIAALAPEQRALLAQRLAPLSFPQERVWLLHQEHPDSPLFLSMAFRIDGALDRTALTRSLNEVVRRHEVLRMVFPLVDGQPRQCVLPHAPTHLPLVDLSGLPEHGRTAEAQRRTAALQQPFDLAKGPLFRACLLRLEAQAHVLAMVAHHMVFDGESSSLLLEGLRRLYARFVRGLPAGLEPLPLAYGDLARQQRLAATGPWLAGQLAYWVRVLGNETPELALPFDRARPPWATHRGARLPVPMSAAAGARLKELARRGEATTFMAVLAAFAGFLTTFGDRAEVAVGTGIANRLARAAEPLIGPFVNVLVLRVDVSGDPSFRTLLGRAREVCLAAFAHQEAPFGRVVQALWPDLPPTHYGARGRPPLFRVCVDVSTIPAATPGGPAGPLRFSPFPSGPLWTGCDLFLSAVDRAGVLAVELIYSAELFRPATGERMVHRLATLIEAMMQQPDLPLAALAACAGTLH
jgi:Condensation domain